MEEYALRDILDVTLAYIIDEGGGDIRARHSMREWAMTGKISQPDDVDDVPAEGTPRSRRAAVPAAERKSIELTPGIKVSQADLDTFAEMGGTMVRKPSRRQSPIPASPDPVA